VDVSPLMIDPNSGQALQNYVSVSIAPTSASVQVNATQQFTATVHNSVNQSVTWDVNGTVGGNATVGWIDTTGLYMAPASATTVTVHATSVATPSAVGSAPVTVTNPTPPVSVTISPTSATVRTGKTAQFTATVQNTSNTAVTWKVNGITGGNSTIGTISNSGLYKAPSSVPSPSTVTVAAVSVADPTKSASASVTISKR
jgi:uncharacterized protein YjdB